LGGLSAVHQFVHIGAHTMVSGGSMVRKDIPPFTKAGREPVSFVGVNSIGLRRRGFSNERINAIQEIYRILYLKGRNITQAVRYIEANVPATPDRDEILSFINNSQRGVMKGYVSIRERV
jgi:UDP-N-acetylglucosamine acyltransferase